MKTFHALLIGSFIAVVLVACGTKLSRDNFAKVQEDMSPQQVEALLGKPANSEMDTIPIIGTQVLTYTYRDKKSEATIVFTDNKVSTKTGSFSQ